MNAPLIKDGLQSLTAELGTSRDKATSVSYKVNEYSEHDLVSAYRTSWLARKIVDIPAQDSTREWRAWKGEEDQIEKIEEEEHRLGLQAKAMRAATLGRLYGAAYLYYDLGDDPSKPINLERVKTGGLRFITVLTHQQLVAGEYDQDPLSPTYGQPQWYDTANSSSGTQRVHPSRVVRFGGYPRPEQELLMDARDDSVLVSLLDAVKQFDSTAANIASLVFEAKIDVIKVNGLMNMAGNPYEEQKLLERYRLAAVAKGNNGMLLLDGENEQYEQKAYSFSALSDIMDRFSQNSAGAADIPMTRLFGRSPGGMNSTGDSDLRNYYDRIKADQNLKLRPALANLDECLIRSALGSRPEEIHYLWNSLWQVSDKERSDLGTATVGMVKSLKETGLLPDEVLAKVTVTALTEDGVLPGLESEYATFFEEGGEWDLDQEEPPVEPGPQGGGPQGGGKPIEVGDKADQPRAPKGSPIGGQWVKQGGGSGGMTPAQAAAVAKITTSKYTAEKLAELAKKPAKELGPYEYHMAKKYKKAMASAGEDKPVKKPAVTGNLPGKQYTQAEYDVAQYKAEMLTPKEAIAVLKGENGVDEELSPAYKAALEEVAYGTPEKIEADIAAAKKMDPVLAIEQLDKYGSVQGLGTLHPKVEKALQEQVQNAYGTPDQIASSLKAAEEMHPKLAKTVLNGPDAEALHPKAKEILEKKVAAAEAAGPEVSAPSPTPSAEIKPLAGTKSAAVAAVTTDKYTEAKLQELMQKDPKTLGPYEKHKLKQYKKALQAEKATATAAAKSGAVDLTSPQAQKDLETIGLSYHGMKAETVMKLGTGEWQPDPSKPWQAKAKADAEEYIKTGQIPTQSIKLSGAKGTSSKSIEAVLINNPPPVTTPNTAQQLHAAIVTPLSSVELSAATGYTGNAYSAINRHLRKGEAASPNILQQITSLDSAVAKTAAKEDMVVLRGVSKDAVSTWMQKNGLTEIKAGATIIDHGFVSTTRKASTASAFGGHSSSSGFGLKIRVPKGSKILPLKSISHYAHEDEFLLPRGSKFKIAAVDEDQSLLVLDLVA